MYIEPKPLERVRAKMLDELQAVYDELPPMVPNMLFEGAPCVVRHPADGRWQRARIMTLCADTCRVCFVDWGDGAFPAYVDVKPLLGRFGKLPPLALKCKMRGVSIIDLETEKLEQFESLLGSLDCLVRVELCSAGDEPFLVNIFHPTVANVNLGSKFHSGPDPYGMQKAEELMRKKKAKEDEELSNDDDDYYYADEGEDEQERQIPKYLLHYPRLDKPIKGENQLSVSHIENAKMIFWKNNYQKRKTLEYEVQLAKILSPESSSIPEDYLQEGVACAFRKVNSTNWFRGLVMNVNDRNVQLITVDHGFRVQLPRSEMETHLKALPAEFDSEPLLSVARLDGLCDDYPWFTETEILRRLLPRNRPVLVTFLKQSFSHGAPYRVNVQLEEDVDLFDAVEMEKQTMGQKRSWEPIAYDGRCGEHLFQQMDVNWDELLHLPRALLKGSLQRTDFEGQSE